MSKATVGIITHNRLHTLGLCLSALEKQTLKPTAVVIVDTSDKNNTGFVRKFKLLPVKYIHLKKRVRQPEARNIIIKNTKTTLLSFLDDDSVPKPGWLRAVLSSFSNPKVAGVTGPAINSTIDLKPLLNIDRSRKNKNYFTSYGDVMMKSQCWIPPSPVKCSTMLGANMSYRLSALRAVGGFVPFYKQGYGFREENFPQVRIIRSGFTFVYNPEAFVYHIKSQKGGSDRDYEHFYLCGKNHRIFADALFPRILTRLSWLFFSRSPPCIWLAVLLAIKRRDLSILKWHRGLWGL